METFIIVIAMIASAAGSLVLLTCLAARRSELVKAFNVQHELQNEEDQEAIPADSNEIPVVS